MDLETKVRAHSSPGFSGWRNTSDAVVRLSHTNNTVARKCRVYDEARYCNVNNVCENGNANKEYAMQLGKVRCTCCVVGVYDDMLVRLRCLHACMKMMIIIVGH
jgi:homoserine acetyltransferase